MNSSRCSSLLVVLVTLVLAVGVAGAVNVSDEDVPREGQVGTDVTATFELTELYTDYDQWTLSGETELGNVTWTVTVFDVAGDEMPARGASYDGQEFGHGVDKGAGAAEVHLKVTGTVPPIANFTYDPAETFLLVELSQTRQGGSRSVIETYEAHHYTEESHAARQAMEDAQAAIDDAGGHQQAERTLASAVSAYESENFQNAEDLGRQAEDTASKANRSQNRLELALMAVGALILLGAIVGGVIYWRNSRTHSRL